MSDIDPLRIARELVEQKKLNGLTEASDALRVIRECYDVSDVDLIEVLRELRVVYDVHFDGHLKPDEDADTSKKSGTNWIIPMPLYY